MLGQIIFIRKKWTHASQLQDALTAIHDGQLITAHQFLQCCRLRAAKEDLAVAVADDGIGVVLIDGFELASCLQHQAGRDLTASDRGDQLFQVRDLADVRRLSQDKKTWQFGGKWSMRPISGQKRRAPVFLMLSVKMTLALVEFSVGQLCK